METNGLEDPEISTPCYSYLIFNKSSQTYVEEKTASSTNGVGSWVSLSFIL
jgi:hypothetical protein